MTEAAQYECSYRRTAHHATARSEYEGRPLEVGVDVVVSVSASEVDEDSGRRLAGVTATEAAVADATTRRTHPLLDHTHTRTPV